jgi:outer membrane lipoprotein-sorting protein
MINVLRGRTLRTSIATIIAVVVMPTLCLAAEYSADMVQKVMGQTINGKVFVKGAKMRQDLTPPQMQGVKPDKMTIIIRGDKKLVWTVMPKTKTYMERATRAGEKTGNNFDVDSIVKEFGGKAAVDQKQLGKETVNGYSCDKYQITPKKKGQGPEIGTVTLWVSKKLGAPLRVKMSGMFSMQIDYKNIREGKVADSVFEIPKGFKKQAMPTMGGMGRGGGMGGGPRGGPGRMGGGGMPR